MADVVPETQTKATPRWSRGVLERNAPEVIAILATGERQADVARLYGVNDAAVTRFVDKHAEAIASVKAQVETEVAGYYIANKVNRIAALNDLFSRMRGELDQYGLTIVEVRYQYDKDGKETGRIETRDFRAALVREMRGVLKDVAEEVGERDGEQDGDGKGGGVAIYDSQVIIVRDVPNLNV